MPPETLDSLDKDSLKVLLLELLAQNKALTEQISMLLVRIAELEARNGQPPKTPTNSSVPPSKGQKANRLEAPAQKKGRKGRPGVARALCPDPDVTREIYAESCSCGAVLSPADQPDVFAYDLIDLPPIKPVTTRINLHKGNCPCCSKRVAAQPPADMAPGTPFGPGVVSLVTYLHACQMVSYNRMTEVLAQMPLSRGRDFCVEVGPCLFLLAGARLRLCRSTAAMRINESPCVTDPPTVISWQDQRHLVKGGVMSLENTREVFLQFLHYFRGQLVIIFVQTFIYALLDRCIATQEDKRDTVFAIL